MIGPRLAAYAVCDTGLLVEGGNIRLMAIVSVNGLDGVGEGCQNQAKGRYPESGNEEKFRTTEDRKVLKFWRSEGEEHITHYWNELKCQPCREGRYRIG